MIRSAHRIALAVILLAGIGLTGGGTAARTAAPQFIAPRGDAAVRAQTNAINQMIRGGTLQVERTDDDPLVLGRTHEHLVQHYKDVPVFGADVVRQFQGTETISVFGAIYDGIDLDTTPQVSALDAQDAVAALSGSDARAIRLPTLVVLPLESGGFALTYQTRAWSAEGPTVYFIDANDGTLTWKYSNLQTQSALRRGKGVLGDDKKVSMRSVSGQIIADDTLRPPSLLTLDMKGNLARTKSILFGFIVPGLADVATASSDPWTDGASVDAHTYAGWTYDYYFKRFGRRGLDNKDTPIVSFVHPAARETIFTASDDDIDTFYLNAFWDGDEMVYGDGLPSTLVLDGQHYNYFSGALDIVAHELTHGVTQYTSDLIYLNESGALNEAFSDIMGTSAEFFYQKVRGRASYLLGDDIVTPGGSRSLADPLSFGDPDHYSRRVIGTADNGGVHSNSGIANNAFYLAVEGGTNRTSGLPVTGVGAANREQIEKVFYRAFTQLMPRNSTFAIARQATIQAARDLYGANSAAERAVTQAWTAVGVN
jgi:bacillolysin